MAAAYDGWHRNHVYDLWADLSLPGVLEHLDQRFGRDGFWLAPNREVLNHVVWRFVVQQHQAMSIDRGFASSPLLHVDGETVIGTAADFSDPSSGNVRFANALQILRDLGLLDRDGTRPTSDGVAWLERMLEEEERRR